MIKEVFLVDYFRWIINMVIELILMEWCHPNAWGNKPKSNFSFSMLIFPWLDHVMLDDVKTFSDSVQKNDKSPFEKITFFFKIFGD